MASGNPSTERCDMDQIHSELARLREVRAKLSLDSPEYKAVTAQMTELYDQLKEMFHGNNLESTGRPEQPSRDNV